MKKIKVLIPVVVLTAIIIILIILLNPDTRYQKLSISQNKWDIIIQTKSSNDELKLEKIEFNESSLIIDETTDTIYYSLINDSKTKYNPNVSFEANENKVKLAILQDEITDEKVHSDYQFKLMIYNSNEYHIYNLSCTDFPILNISYNTQELGRKKNKNIPIDVYIYDNMENSSKRITRSKGIMDILDIDGKTVYEFDLVMNSPGKNQRENHLSIFNMDPHNKYLLTQEEESIGNIRDFKVEFFINSQYQGQYSIKNGIGSSQ